MTPGKANLHLLTGDTVTRIVVDPDRANGIESSDGENAARNTVDAFREVFLAARALKTPQILQLSDIGDLAYLSNLCLEVVADLPSVGSNYHDHLLLFTGQAGKSPVMLDGTRSTWY